MVLITGMPDIGDMADQAGYGMEGIGNYMGEAGDGIADFGNKSYITRLLKGIKESSINFKCWRAKGIPIIVRNSMAAKKR